MFAPFLPLVLSFNTLQLAHAFAPNNVISLAFTNIKTSNDNQQSNDIGVATWRSRNRRSIGELLILKDRKRWDDEIEENTWRRAQQKAASGSTGIGETAAGAVLGGLLGGPFGALFGASIGSNFGERNALKKARQEEMERLGLTQEMLDTANDVGLALEQASEGLVLTKDSLATQQSFARMLDKDATDLYEKAKIAMAEDREEDARKFLMERTEIQEKLKSVLLRCAEEKKRLEKQEENVKALERRAIEVDSLMRRNVSAKTIQESSDLGLSLQSEDPLLKRFKDLGID